MYDFKKTEEKWADIWEKEGVYKFKDDLQKPKFYILDMFPYPSGSGLHVGHLKGYLATDIWARYYKMRGYSVFHPMGWDAFGLPAEQYAIQTGNSPLDFTLKNIDSFRSQLKRLSLSYDFDREINTSSPDYYKHTQWIFSQMYKKGLANLRNSLVNWCEELNTVLADEEIIEEGGKRYSERGNYEVTYKKLEQWVLKITEYASALYDGIDGLDWPDNIKKIQKHWIGKSNKYRFAFSYEGNRYFLNLKYASNIKKLKGIGIHFFSSLSEKLDLSKFVEKKQLTDLFLVDCFDGSKIPVYFLQDIDFRAEDLLPIFVEDEEKIVDFEEEKQFVQKYKGSYFESVVTFKLKDWVFSRQRFWGEPIPVLFGEDGTIKLEENLPLVLPEKVDYSLSREGKSPLSQNGDWIHASEGGKKYTRESNTMPNWAGSSWYFIAYLLKKEDGTFYDLDSPEAKQILDRWLPVDVYVGGQEHAAMHLLYARFWYKFLNQIGVVSGDEPFKTLFNQGMVLGEDGAKMSKSKGNSVNITEMVEKYGSDALRLYEAFSGPVFLSFKWEESGIRAIQKWMFKVHSFFEDLSQYKEVDDQDQEVNKLENNLIRNLSSCIPSLKINVGVSEMMIFLNKIQELKRYHHKSLRTFVKILSFYAPAMAEELWREKLNQKTFLFLTTWPSLNEEMESNFYEYKVFVKGKFKFMLNLDKSKAGNLDHIRDLVLRELKNIPGDFKMGINEGQKVIHIS